MGLFAGKEFWKSDPITWYDGEYVEADELEVLRLADHLAHVLTHAYRLPLSKYTVLGLQTPQSGRGGGSFCNDGTRSGHKNNCEPRITSQINHQMMINHGSIPVLSHGLLANEPNKIGTFRLPLPVMTLFATQHIPPGTELLFDYIDFTEIITAGSLKAQRDAGNVVRNPHESVPDKRVCSGGSTSNCATTTSHGGEVSGSASDRDRVPISDPSSVQEPEDHPMHATSDLPSLNTVPFRITPTPSQPQTTAEVEQDLHGLHNVGYMSPLSVLAETAQTAGCFVQNDTSSHLAKPPQSQIEENCGNVADSDGARDDEGNRDGGVDEDDQRSIKRHRTVWSDDEDEDED
jgi:hypothetical protein